MAYEFPSAAWVQALEDALNGDGRYARVARNWEGDIVFAVDPDDPPRSGGADRRVIYLDLWHGRCRRSSYHQTAAEAPAKPSFTLTARRTDFVRVLSGNLDPMQAMLTRKIHVSGDFGYFLKNVPVVLDFVRCCQKVEARL